MFDLKYIKSQRYYCQLYFIFTVIGFAWLASACRLFVSQIKLLLRNAEFLHEKQSFSVDLVYINHLNPLHNIVRCSAFVVGGRDV